MRAFVACILSVNTYLSAADTNVLVLGSSRSFSQDQYSEISRNQQAFNPQLIAGELDNILAGDNSLGTVNVVFEDTYKSSPRSLYTTSNPPGNPANFNAKCYGLLSYYYLPAGRADRLNNLKGLSGTQWDYVVILGDLSFISSTPGVYAKGVKLIVDTIKQGSAEPILMMQWPHAGSSVPVADFAEVTYRVGDSGGIPVAPAGYAWEDLTSKDSGSHPTPNGAYLAAASLYSKMFDRNATTSNYQYNDPLAVLYVEPTQTVIKLAVDEDQVGDTERGHTTEPVSYLIIEDSLP